MSLAQHLGTQHKALADFVSLLEEEQSELAKSAINGEIISDIARRKTLLVELIESLETKRRRGQSVLGYPIGIEGARKAAADGGCTELWDTIINLSHRARSLNEINGEQVRMRLDQTSRQIDFVNRAAGGVLYGRDGKSKIKSLGGISTKA
jgi:flagellar biosynthesis/type III secretory pathway chaperone